MTPFTREIKNLWPKGSLGQGTPNHSGPNFWYLDEVYIYRIYIYNYIYIYISINGKNRDSLYGAWQNNIYIFYASIQNPWQPCHLHDCQVQRNFTNLNSERKGSWRPLRLPGKLSDIWRIRFLPWFSRIKGWKSESTSTAWMLEVRINMDQWLGSMGYKLLINGVYWDYNL